jgi:hypothetical protein
MDREQFFEMQHRLNALLSTHFPSVKTQVVENGKVINGFDDLDKSNEDTYFCIDNWLKIYPFGESGGKGKLAVMEGDKEVLCKNVSLQEILNTVMIYLMIRAVTQESDNHRKSTCRSF